VTGNQCVIVRLMGGLGNQLFQYASARSLALRLQLPLYLDARWYARQQLRKLDLFNFAVASVEAPDDVLRRCPSAQDGVPKRVERWLGGHLYPSAWPAVIQEADGDRLDDVGDNVTRSLYLVGYWQDASYFDSWWHVLSDELEPSVPLTQETVMLLRSIEDESSVSIHVRRGDFVAGGDVSAIHEVCGADYYAAAMKRVAAIVPDPKFFVFSDDPIWARQHLHGPSLTFVDAQTPRPPHEDLVLMSRCDAHIISNSTFGWWGAWLGNGRVGTVIAPRRWSRGERGFDAVGDPCLPHWVRL